MFCPNCGKQSLPNDKFCHSCGRSLERAATAFSSASPMGQPSQASLPPSAPSEQVKSPAGAAVLNFFLPGMGYVYTGLGRDAGEVVFGFLVFLFYTVGLWGGVIAVSLSNAGIGSGGGGSSGTVSPFDALILLAFLLPFAFAYDGYRRAKFA
ncbi:MAG: zinc ribbon domain-containing protein [archaeon]|nr:MAG: zinc ribbon domain-containing protein [archaeon]